MASGRRLDARLQGSAERRLGHSLEGVRVHHERPESTTADALDTPAYAVGRHIVFGAGQYSPDTPHGRQILFHELAHAAQQPEISTGVLPSRPRIGARGDRAEREASAAALALSSERPADLKMAPLELGPPVIRCYEAGEHAQLGEPGISVTVQGHQITYGEMIAMGDFFASPDEVRKAPWAVIEKLLELIRRDRDFLTGVPGAKKVDEKEWQAATEKLPKGKRYLDLAAKNVTHFAVENKKTWEKLHKQALKLAQKGSVDDALLVNGFADHFLTDAFAAGHLIQRDVVTKGAKKRITKGNPKQFSYDVSAAILADPDANKLLMQYEVNPTIWPSWIYTDWKPMSVDSLTELIEIIRKHQPDYFYSNFAKAIHDALNADIKSHKGVQVRNKRGDQLTPGGAPFWELSGDKTLSLSPKTRDVAKRAVAESRQQVTAAKGAKKIDYDAQAAKVWENVPEPTAAGKRQIESTTQTLTDPTDPAAIAAFAQIAIDARETLVSELEKRKFIRRLPSASAAGVHAPRRTVATWAGTWETDKYDIVKSGKAEVGVDIVLRFKPGFAVNSTKFGMVQMVTSKGGGKVIALNPTIAARSIPKGQPGEGAHIDQLAQFRNPLYATGPTTPKDTLKTTKTHSGWGQHGWRWVDPAGKLHKKDALLKDTPALDPHPANSSQIFETTALAVDGVQEGTYYGSVQWGWQSDAHNKFAQLPLSRVSDDVPSSIFAATVPLWNKTPTSLGQKTIPFAAATGAYTKAAGASLVSDPSKPKDVTVTKIAKNTRLEVTQTSGTWSKVTLVAGGSIGGVGWIKSSALSNKITP